MYRMITNLKAWQEYLVNSEKFKVWLNVYKKSQKEQKVMPMFFNSKLGSLWCLSSF